jgi:uncharacterized protein (DUF2164 family)
MELIALIVAKLPREHKELLIQRLQAFFIEERSEEIGELAAELLLDFMLKELGPVVYNQAVQDATRLVAQRMTSLEEDLHALEKPVK